MASEDTPVSEHVGSQRPPLAQLFADRCRLRPFLQGVQHPACASRPLRWRVLGQVGTQGRRRRILGNFHLAWRCPEPRGVSVAAEGIH